LRKIHRLHVRRRLLHQHRHGDRTPSADASDLQVRGPGPSAEIWFSNETPDPHQARLQEPQAHHVDVRQQRVSRRVLGGPVLQLVQRQLMKPLEIAALATFLAGGAGAWAAEAPGKPMKMDEPMHGETKKESTKKADVKEA